MNPTVKLLGQKVGRLSDELLQEFAGEHQDTIYNWRNWGNNIEKMMAEEAHRRGLIA